MDGIEKMELSSNIDRVDAYANDPQTFAIIGAAMEVHRILGAGFLEYVYQEALAIELEKRAIPFQREVMLQVHYKEMTLTSNFRADFICYGEIIVELKAMDNVTSIEQAQVYNYLKATGYGRGLLLNFGARSLQQRRLFLKDQ